MKPLDTAHRMLAVATTATLLALASGQAFAHGDEAVARAQEAIQDYRYDQALAHYREAAQLGNRFAQRTLAMMLLKGEALYGKEVAADRTEAIKWFTAAAEKGCGVSKFMLTKLKAGSAPVRS